MGRLPLTGELHFKLFTWYSGGQTSGYFSALRPDTVEETHSMANGNDVSWWSRTKGLMITCLAIWAIFSFVIHFFVGGLNEITFLGFPLGYYMAAQGSLIVFVILVFWFSGRQDSIDCEFGVAEDDY
jgi:putative solute:sodium symporter small subunit